MTTTAIVNHSFNIPKCDLAFRTVSLTSLLGALVPPQTARLSVSFFFLFLYIFKADQVFFFFNSRTQTPLSHSASRTRPTHRSHTLISNSPSYLEITSTCSQTLTKLMHKLLVLDLNGTLLHSPPPPKPYRGRRHQHPAPRRIMPRPYLTAFRTYLFAPRTRAWLDVMVWSSAQPHSVEDMMLDTFGRD